MPRVSRFLERLAAGPPIVADGGMGALISAAVPRLRSPEEANVRAPQAVVSLHLGFINAGAELIETNSFGANRRKLAAHYLENELETINSTAVRLARDARGGDRGRGRGAFEQPRRRGDGREPWSRPHGRARRPGADGWGREAARGAAEHRPREPGRGPRRLPTCDA